MDIYDLTPLTLRANEGRRISFQGFDLDRRHFWIIVVASLFIVPIIAVCYGPLKMGVYALLLAPFLYGIPFFLIETRSREGLKLRRYQAMMDSRMSNTGKFIMCGKEIYPATHRPRVLRKLTRPVAGSYQNKTHQQRIEDTERLFS